MEQNMSDLIEQIKSLGYEISVTDFRRDPYPQPMTRATYNNQHFFFIEEKDGWVYWEEGGYDWSGHDDPDDFLQMLRNAL